MRNALPICGFRLALVSVALFAIPSCPVRADDVPREVVQSGKRATAYVETKEGSGSAFCIDSEGEFITNEHVVGTNKHVLLVINPGEKDQKVEKAVVAFADADLDLALLVTEHPGHYSALQLAPNNNDLVETSTLVVFGFPLGRDLAVTEGSYPSVTVTIGRVTALRKDKGELAGIQLDASVTHGNSGGPVVDSHGKVIGILEAGISGAALNFAIPVERLHFMMNAPHVSIVSDDIPDSKQHNSNTLTFEIGNLSQKHLDFRPEFVLNPGDDHNHTLTMNSRGNGRFTVTIPAHDGPAPKFEIKVKLDGEIISVFDGVMPVKGASIAAEKAPEKAPGASHDRPTSPSSSAAKGFTVTLPKGGPLVTNGPLAFKQPIEIKIPGAGTISGLQVKDIDGDGHLDILVNTDNDFVILYGHGDGVTYDMVRYPLTKRCGNLAVADFNKDGKLDIVLLGGGGASVMLGQGKRKFSEPQFYPTGDAHQGVAIADFNGDGYPDLAVTNMNSKTCSVLLNRGDGTFNEAHSFGAGQYPVGVVTGDFNGDGKLDIAIGGFYGRNIDYYFGDGKGGFSRGKPGAEVGGGQLIAGNFAGKFVPGLVGVDYWGHSVAAAGLDPVEGFRKTDGHEAGGYPSQVALGDIRGVGIADIIFGSQGTNTFTICLGHGDGTFTDGLVFHVEDGDVHGAVIADMNEDGSADVISDGGGERLFIFLNANPGKK